MIRRLLLVLGLPLLVSGCFEDGGSPGDTTPPAAPRGLYSITGDHEVTLRWVSNTEPDLVGYRLYSAPCPSGGDCPFDRVGFTAGTSFDVTGLTNGTKQWFAVAAVDRAGNESDLTYENISDVPRPANHRGGYNVLFIGGNVRFCTSPNVGVDGDDIFVNQASQVAAGLNRMDSVLAPGHTPP